MRAPVDHIALEAAEIVEFLDAGAQVRDHELYSTMTKLYPRLRGQWAELVAELEKIGRRRGTFTHEGSTWFHTPHGTPAERGGAKTGRWWRRHRERRQATASAAVRSACRCAGGGADALIAQASYETVVALFDEGYTDAAQFVARRAGMFTNADATLARILDAEQRSHAAGTCTPAAGAALPGEQVA